MKKKRIWVAGHKGMVGSALVRHLERRGDEVITADRSVVDLRNQIAVEVWLKQNRPDTILFAAAKVGGILANDSFSADFIYDNLAIETNIIHSAHVADIDRLVFLGSSCIYPKFAQQPIKEEALLTGRVVQFSIQSRHGKDKIEIERGAPPGVFDIVASGGPEQIVGEGAQAGGDVRVLANA